MKFPDLDTPVNVNERYLHAIAVRMDALCHMMSSFLEVYAKQNGITTESNSTTEKVTESPARPKRTKSVK